MKNEVASIAAAAGEGNYGRRWKHKYNRALMMVLLPVTNGQKLRLEGMIKSRMTIIIPAVASSAASASWLTTLM